MENIFHPSSLSNLSLGKMSVETHRRSVSLNPPRLSLAVVKATALFHLGDPSFGLKGSVK